MTDGHSVTGPQWSFRRSGEHVSIIEKLPAKAFESRFRGAGAWLTTIVRIGSGLFFISVSTGKFFDHAQEAIDFERYEVPLPEVAVYVAGTIELVGGVLLVLGLFTRLGAALLAGNLIGAIATAGRVEGGSFHLGVGPTMLLLMLFLVWAGPGEFALDRRLLDRIRRSPAAPT